jgi:tetratricopeptide (TPR) repeat protein
MLATSLHSKYIMSGTVAPLGVDLRDRDEDEMEELVTASLPHLANNSILLMAAGKLLYFLDRGHRSLGIDILEDAFRSSSAFAAAFTTYGQLQMHLGNIENALALFEQGFELCEPGSDFYFYMLVLKVQALIANDDRERADTILDDAYQKAATTRAALSVMFAPEAGVAIHPQTRAMFDMIDENRARNLLVWMNYMSARLFRFTDHGANILKGPASRFIERFGPRVVPDETRHHFSQLKPA